MKNIYLLIATLLFNMLLLLSPGISSAQDDLCRYAGSTQADRDLCRTLVAVNEQIRINQEKRAKEQEWEEHWKQREQRRREMESKLSEEEKRQRREARQQRTREIFEEACRENKAFCSDEPTVTETKEEKPVPPTIEDRQAKLKKALESLMKTSK